MDNMMNDVNEFGEQRRPMREMRRQAEAMLGHWVKMKDGSMLMHIESDVPILRMYDPARKEIKLVDIKDVAEVMSEIVAPR